MHRLAVYLVAAVWCATPLLSALHASVEAHRFCAEHGVIEETSAVAEGTAPVSSDQPIARGTDAGTSHEECAFHASGRLQGPSGAVTSEASALEIPCAAPPRRSDPVPQLAIVDYAPKTSPPA
jgi:hypothetical protein